jgi:acyl-CoA thioester hydrolase
MARVKLNFPLTNPIFSAHIPLRITDMNYGNHLGNDVMLSIIHDARMQFLSSAGFTELNAGGPGMIMADVMVSYKNEGLYGDHLKVDLFVDEITSRSFDFLYRVTTLRSGKVMAIADAKTGMVSFDYTTGKVCSTSTALQERLKLG